MDLHVAGLTVHRGARQVLAIPELVLPGGSTTALVGPNGAGKSTLLRVMAGLERPSAGSVTFDGATSARPDALRRRVAYAFQRAVFLSGSVEDNFRLALSLRGIPAAEWAARIADVAEVFGVSHLLGRRTSRLSGGEAQRVNLARALALRAPLTLLDEPLAGFDSPTRRALLHDLPAMLRRFATTLVVVTHDRDEALRLAGRLVILIDGRVRAEGDRARIFSHPPDADVAAFLGYTIIQRATETLAIAPRALRMGDGDVAFSFAVDDVLDFGGRREAWGRIGEAQAAVSVRGPAPAIGSMVQVAADAADVRSYAPVPGRAPDVR
ncbi:MAG: ATP-binding cassette domain-containing protein [Dehalococcoidia bacterium]